MTTINIAKIQRELAKAQELMAAAGLDVSALQTEVAIDTAKVDEIVAQAEGVLAFLENPKAFIKRARSCSWCERTFIPLPPSVGYCSNDCRRRALAEWGLTWDYSKDSQERWGLSGTPLIVPPEVVEFLKSLTPEPLSEATA